MVQVYGVIPRAERKAAVAPRAARAIPLPQFTGLGRELVGAPAEGGRRA